jgi:HK97 family phage portal protein
LPSAIGRLLKVRNAAPPVPMSGRRGFGQPMLAATPGDEALMRCYGGNGTNFANVSLLASSSAKPEWKLYRKQPADGRRRYTTSDQGSDQRTEVVQHQALSVLYAPALPLITRYFLFELSGIWLEQTGKSHWVVGYDPRASFPMNMWPVRPDRMTPVADRSNFLAGWIYTAPDGREKIPLLPREVIYNRYPDPMDPLGGAGPIGSVLTDIETQRLGADWNRNFFYNSAAPGGVIQVDHELEDDDFDRLTDRWRDAHRGVSRAHRVAVLEGGQTWVPNSMTVRDMDFGNLRTGGRDIIREALGMHKVMTGVTDDVNRANAQTGEEVFASWKIVPRLDRWKDVLNFQYLPLFYPAKAEVPVEFDYSFPMPLNREQDNAELVAKATAAQLLVEAGYDPAEVTEVVGLPAMKTVAAAAGPVPAEPDAVPGDQPDDMTARLRKVLANGHLPVLAGGPR